MPRIVCLLGSPRPLGSSDLLAEKFCTAAQNAGAEVITHALRDLRYQGYRPPTDGLYDYSTDDLDPVLADVLAAEYLVLATPIYFSDMTGLMKQALDRFDAFLTKDPETGILRSELGTKKTLLLIQVQGSDDTKHKDMMTHYKPAFDTLGFARQECLRACGIQEPQDLIADPQTLDAAESLAIELFRREYA